ncbi:hypothetical protein TNCV_1476321 [Trichonephila clavipes]|nr:hypothetical protein TNCV_1476321 [Trichonephila clavipes]
MDYFNSTEYVIVDGGGKTHYVSYRVFQMDSLFTLLGWQWSLLIPRISVEVPAHRWNPVIGFLTAFGCQRVVIRQDPQYFRDARVNMNGVMLSVQRSCGVRKRYSVLSAELLASEERRFRIAV